MAHSAEPTVNPKHGTSSVLENSVKVSTQPPKADVPSLKSKAFNNRTVLH